MADKCAVGLSTAVPHTPRARGEGGEVGGGFLSSQWSAGVPGESGTISPSVSIVADAGRRLWPCGGRGLTV